jgi:hypothetical protein
MGRYRQFRDGCVDSSGYVNAWSVVNIPLSSTQCTQMYNDCASDLFCSTPHRTYFDIPEITPETCSSATSSDCVRGDVLYSSPADMCATMWAGNANTSAGYIPAFVSTTGPVNSYYVFPGKGDAPFGTTNPNPNDSVNTTLGSASSIWPTTPEYPHLCPQRPRFNTTTQCINDIYYYFGMRDAVGLYSNPSATPVATITTNSTGIYFVSTSQSASSDAGRIGALALASVAVLFVALLA